MNYSYLPYDPIFPKLFLKEKKYLQKIIGNDSVIEHFGSTAVPGLHGKGVIDIYILVLKQRMKAVSEILQKNGYVYKNYASEKDRLFHDINKKYYDKRYHFHLHLSSIGNKNFADCIRFRDYLMKHPDAVEKYQKIKRIAIKKTKGVTDRKEIIRIYFETKSVVVKEILKLVVK